MNQQTLPDIPAVTPRGVPADGPDSSIERMQNVFHELHADGRHALCAVCQG
jgi:hypothetical protein